MQNDQQREKGTEKNSLEVEKYFTMSFVRTLDEHQNSIPIRHQCP